MELWHRARAGRYAQARYKRGLHSHRKQLRLPLVVVAAPLFLAYLAIYFLHGFEWWSFAAGVICTMSVALVMFTWGEPPQYVQKWKRGAEGERKTEKVLRPLERQGWKVEHDIQRDGRANHDHVVTGPSGVFLLETKNLAGTVTFENGVLVARQFDDPDEVFHYKTLLAQLGGQAKELSARLRAETGQGVWVNTVVVIWGHFPTGRASYGNVTYIRGDMLKDWLIAEATKRGSRAPAPMNSRSCVRRPGSILRRVLGQI